MKMCAACRENKDESHFTFISTRGYYMPRCRPCNNAHQSARRALRLDEYRAAQRERRLRNPAQAMLYSTRQSARMAGIPHTLTLADIVVPDKCPILGIPLANGAKAACDSSPSLDRIDPSKGYVPGNVQVISYKANTMKSNATPSELRAFAEWILRAHPRD